MTIPALITRLEALTGPDRDIDADIQRALGLEPSDMDFEGLPSSITWQAVRAFARTFTSSIDDALTLVPEGLEWHVAGPNKRHTIRKPKNGNGQAWAGVFGEPFVGSENDSFAANPAIALCIACLRAMEEGN
jgi:hypothetical protein